MKGLSEWNGEMWTPLVGVFHSSEDAQDVVSDVYSSLWFSRHWASAYMNGVKWDDFIKGGLLKYRPLNDGDGFVRTGIGGGVGRPIASDG